MIITTGNFTQRETIIGSFIQWKILHSEQCKREPMYFQNQTLREKKVNNNIKNIKREIW